MKSSTAIYSINIIDVQQVAEEILNRKLNSKELEIIEKEIGNYIDWYEAIENSINKKIIKLPDE
jgi:hypothetical protein